MQQKRIVFLKKQQNIFDGVGIRPLEIKVSTWQFPYFMQQKRIVFLEKQLVKLDITRIV